MRRKPEAARIPSEPREHKEPLVLILAEASETHRELMAELLSEDAGIRVQPAADGQKALELVRKTSPDVLIADLFLPGLSGVALTKQCRAEGMKGCILLQTFTSTIKAYSAAAEAGADGMIEKPVNVERLLKELQPLRYGLRGKYRDLLNRMDGGAARLLGKEMAALCAERRALFPKFPLKQIYIDLAREERTSPECVEKNIRKYIRYLHEKNSKLYQTRIGTAPSGKPLSNQKFFDALKEAAKFPEESEGESVYDNSQDVE